MLGANPCRSFRGVWRRSIALTLSALYILSFVFAVLALLRPGKPPELPKAHVVAPGLSRHLLFVIVDGLRYDFATDPKRMPNFAAAMARHRSADILAGPVSMTSSAVQSFASGQRGRLEQIARNINPDPPPFQSWMQNARDAGKKVALVGDRVWQEMYGHAFDEMLLDPPGVAIDLDFNEKTFRDARTTLPHAADAMVLHFVTPDHQGHAYGTGSERYRKHLLNFDHLLFELLSEVGQDWTVIVTSDHGANDAGDHGGDVLLHRRSPIFAYGPGIAPKSESPQLDQVDVAGTLAALLGTPAPCHSQGHLLVDWLAFPQETRAKVALNDVARALTFAHALDADAAAPLEQQLQQARVTLAAEPEKQVTEARRLATDSDALIRNSQGIFSHRAWWTLGAVTLGAAVITWLWLAPIGVGPAASSLFIALVSIALTALVEKLPGKWPTSAAGILFGFFNIPTLVLLLRPERFVTWLSRTRAYAPVVVPGILAVTYPRNLQPVAYAVTLIIPLIVLGAGARETWGLSLSSRSRERAIDSGLMLLWGLALLPAGWFPDGLPSLKLGQHPNLIVAMGVLLVISAGYEIARRFPDAKREIALLVVAVLACVFLRRVSGTWLGRGALLLLPVAAIWPLLRGRVALGQLLLLCGYTWVSRDIELPTVAAALGLASLVGRRSAEGLQGQSAGARVLTLLGFWFALSFVLRLGVGGGIDPTHLDLAAGAFGDRAVSASWVGFCIVWKNLVAQTLVGSAFLGAFSEKEASQMARGFGAAWVCRAAVLLGMMLCAQGSFWTSMRVIGELPYSMILFAAAGSAWLAQRLARNERSASANVA